MVLLLFIGVVVPDVVTQIGNTLGKVNDSFFYPVEIIKFISVIKGLKEFEGIFDRGEDKEGIVFPFRVLLNYGEKSTLIADCVILSDRPSVYLPLIY